ncbi:hypothetical protein QQM79_06145 [Marinobacteraceae bacterium S3BR75-40.1]
MALLLFLNTWLLSRLWFTFRDDPLPRSQTLILGAVQLLLTGLVTPGYATLWLGFAVVVSLLLSEGMAPRERLNEARLTGTFLVLLTALGLYWVAPPTSWLLTQVQLTALQPILLGLLGFLLVANETNLAIRALLYRFQMEPTTANAPSRTVDVREYNAGRVIGMLERWLIYLVLVVAQNYNVIALIIAAKGFARFRQLDQREFAEYVLIGTLASILFTTLIALMILQLQ